MARGRGDSDENLGVFTGFKDGRNAVCTDIRGRVGWVERGIGYQLDGSSHQLWVDIAMRFFVAFLVGGHKEE